LKITAATPKLRAGDASANAQAIAEAITDAHAKGSQVIVMPELCLTGATGGSTLHQRTTAEYAEDKLLEVAAATRGRDILAVVGLPLKIDDKIFNVAAVVQGGKVLGFVPKLTFLDGFACPAKLPFDSITVGNYAVPFGYNLMFRNSLGSYLTIAIVVGESLSAGHPIASEFARAGANIILNPTSSLSLLGDENRLSSLRVFSQNLKCGVVSVSSGAGESTSVGVYSGDKFIIENGHVLSAASRTTALIVSDIDTEVLYNSRIKNPLPSSEYKFASCDIRVPENNVPLDRHVTGLPYVPQEAGTFEKVLNILATGVLDRLKSIGADKVVVGVSGGWDSTCVLLVLKEMCKIGKLPPKTVLGVTMPGYGTSERTKTNAKKIMTALGIEQMEIPISDAVTAHLKDIGCADLKSVTAENAQARERAQILLDLANRHNGFVAGTSDMSEIALGWTTYGGDQLAHYNCISSLSKTFIRAFLRHVSFFTENKALASVVADILATPASPELLKGQVTENMIGPYELHDFFLYNMILQGFSPKKTLFLAGLAFPNYTQTLVKKTLKTFLTRFFQNQFKRSASCDGVRISDFDLDSFKVHSDISPEIYLGQV
jgi:NAD+ synthase (glutamine-hydrolysing)